MVKIGDQPRRSFGCTGDNVEDSPLVDAERESVTLASRSRNGALELGGPFLWRLPIHVGNLHEPSGRRLGALWQPVKNVKPHAIEGSCDGRWVILHPETIVGAWLGPPVSASVDMAKLAPLRMILGF